MHILYNIDIARYLATINSRYFVVAYNLIFLKQQHYRNHIYFTLFYFNFKFPVGRFALRT